MRSLLSHLLILVCPLCLPFPSLSFPSFFNSLLAGIRRYSQEVGRLWVALSDYYIRLGHFEKARDVLEEGISTVNTIRDFSLIFDAYARFEETMLKAKMESAEDVCAFLQLLFCPCVGLL